MPFTNCSKLFIDPTVRVTAADSLRSLRATDAIPALQNSLQSEGDEVAREHLRETLRVLQLLPIGIKKRRKKQTPDSKQRALQRPAHASPND